MTFLEMHQQRTGFVMPNAWDAGSAVLLAEAGFVAIATTSSGIAHSLGMADFVVPESVRRVSRAEMLARARAIVEAVDVPVSADLENGYGDTPEDVAETIKLAIDAGLAGANIEDHRNGALYDVELAVERITAAREVVDASGSGFVLTGRTDSHMLAPDSGPADAIARLNRYRTAGADCLYSSYALDMATIATLAREVDGPLNVLMHPHHTVAELRAAGAARISLGGSIARAAYDVVRNGARELAEQGTSTFADIPRPQVFNEIFAHRVVPIG
jgi:2-methylisocitrate lyase-like PEP mutase family enzyme